MTAGAIANITALLIIAQQKFSHINDEEKDHLTN